MPEDRRCIEIASDDWDIAVLRWAFSDVMLVLMIWAMTQSFR